MNNFPKTYQVAIVGGGAVGLFLGICLEQLGISCIILEKRVEVREGSRSLGIHPVSLELFEKMDICEAFVNQGIQIAKGHAFANDQKMGTLSFEDCPKPHNYILALPQDKTESILEKKLFDLNPDILIRGAEVTGFNQSNKEVGVTFRHDGKTKYISAEFLIGCDGKHSFVRQKAGIAFEGKTYPDTYIMGDFSDNTELESDAAIFLCDEGLIESFPLLNNRRRWVVKTDEYISSPNRNAIEERVSQRIGHDLSGTENVMLSSFGVQKLIAEPMVKNRVILAGDAAHVVSPIGGQGMNLGWLGGWDLAQSLQRIFNNEASHNYILSQFEGRREKAAKNSMRRAELNMRLGRKAQFPAVRNAIVSLMLKKPFSQLMARIFTMRGVERWVL